MKKSLRIEMNIDATGEALTPAVLGGNDADCNNNDSNDGGATAG